MPRKLSEVEAPAVDPKVLDCREMPLNLAYERFREEMKDAVESLETRTDGGRDAVCSACHSVIRLIFTQEDTPDFAFPFRKVMDALMDLEAGIVHELISANSADSKRSKSRAKRYLKCWTAVLLQRFVERGEELKLAADKVCRHALDWPELAGQDISSWGIIAWRKQFLSEGKRTSGGRDFTNFYHRLKNDKDESRLLAEYLTNGPPGTVKR